MINFLFKTTNKIIYKLTNIILKPIVREVCKSEYGVPKQGTYKQLQKSENVFSFHNCVESVQKNNPEAIGLTYDADSERCIAFAGASVEIVPAQNDPFNSKQSCIFEGKLLIV